MIAIPLAVALLLEIVAQGEPRPAVLATLEAGPDVHAVAVGADGTRAATATLVEAARRGSRTTLRLLDAAGTLTSFEIPGVVRDLLFSPDGSRLFLLAHTIGRRGLEQTDLVVVDLDAPKPRRIPLPPSARSLAYWPGGRALVIAASDELRSLLLPELRSGPLWLLPGANTAAAPLGGARMLLGRQMSLALVDLDDPPEEERMPEREALATPSPVVRLAGSGGLAPPLVQLADGRILEVELEPLRLGAERGRGLLASRPWSSLPAPRPDPPRPEPPPPPPPPPSLPRPAAPPTVSPPVSRGAQLGGALSGPAAEEVEAVAILGPNSIVREARRVRPADDGRWEVEGLAPGRYRVQLIGRGGRALVSTPAFATVDVQGEWPVLVDFRVLRAL